MSKPIDPKRWSEGRVYALRRWTGTLYSVQVEAEVQPFLAGQFTKLGLQLDAEFVERPYSYVNAPQEMPLEFYFVTVPDGPLTRAMTVLQPGDPIWVMRRPSGFLTVNEVPDARHLWMLATGTAIGPFLSILKTGEPWQRFERHHQGVRGPPSAPVPVHTVCQPRADRLCAAGAHSGGAAVHPARAARRAGHPSGDLPDHDLRQPGHGQGDLGRVAGTRTGTQPAPHAGTHHRGKLLVTPVFPP
jgi:hypothetical protein